MRNTILTGLALAISAALVVVLSSTFDLGLESAALLGVAVGAVVALVPDRTPVFRVAGFMAGFVIAFVGYAARAAALPDSAGGQAIVVALVVLLCVTATATSLERLPLWSTLLGAASVAGAYEFTFADAVPEMASTSVSTATALLLTVAVGFLAAAFVAPAYSNNRTGDKATEPATPLGDLMTEKSL